MYPSVAQTTWGAALNVSKDMEQNIKIGDRWYVLTTCIDCGREKKTRKDCYSEGRSQRCKACAMKVRPDVVYGKNRKHWGKGTLTYTSWMKMRRRCRLGAEHHPTYEGLEVCDRWNDYQNFLADMGDRPSQSHTIERKDNAKGYYPDNCCWATKGQQNRNRSNNRLLTHENKTQCLKDWAKEKGLTRGCLESRLNSGWSVERALSTPPRLYIDGRKNGHA